MKRRRFVAVAAGALAWPVLSLAQPKGALRRIGFLSLLRRPASLDAEFYGAFRSGLRDLGYVEGQNLVIEWRFAEGQSERLLPLALELVQRPVDLILAAGTEATRAAQKATATVPIVMGPVGDPVASGFAKSLARPGGNITGVSNLGGDIGPKHLELLRSVVPGLSRVAVIMRRDNSSHPAILRTIEAVAQKAGLNVQPLFAQSPQELDAAFAAAVQERAGAVIFASDQFFLQQRQQMASLSIRHRIPSIITNREFAEAGGLMSYGHDVVDLYRRAASYVDRILKGADPASLPIEQPTKIQLVVNLKTARTLGIAIPQSILVRADRVID